MFDAMRTWVVSLLGLFVAGCQGDMLDDWGADGEPACAPASCGADHARLAVAVPMAEGQIQQTDLWLNVCYAGNCENDVHLEWKSQRSGQPCDLQCTAGANLLGGRVLARRGGSCAASEADLCLEFDFPTDGLSTQRAEIALQLDDGVSGRRVADGAFEVELAERVLEVCGQPTTCLNGERRELMAAFDPATASPGTH